MAKVIVQSDDGEEFLSYDVRPAPAWGDQLLYFGGIQGRHSFNAQLIDALQNALEKDWRQQR